MCPLVKIILNFSANGHKAKGTFYVLTNSFLAFFPFRILLSSRTTFSAIKQSKLILNIEN